MPHPKVAAELLRQPDLRRLLVRFLILLIIIIGCLIIVSSS